MEKWDVLDGMGRRTGKAVPAGERLSDGEFHGAVTAWIRNRKGEFLIVQRDDGCDSMPGKWEAVSGSVLSGEESLAAALREVSEETGIVLDRETAQHFCSYTWPMGNGMGGAYYDVWLFDKEAAIERIRLQEGETCAAMGAGAQRLRDMKEKGELIPYSYLERLLAFAP